MIKKNSLIYKLIKDNNIEWFITINNTDNINSKNFFKIVHIIDFHDNVVIVSDIESINNNYYRITILDELLDANLIKINKENKSIERYINNTKNNKKNFIKIINNKFNMNTDLYCSIIETSNENSLNTTLKRPMTPKIILPSLPLQNITSILSPKKNLYRPELMPKSIINNNFLTNRISSPIAKKNIIDNLFENKFDKLR